MGFPSPADDYIQEPIDLNDVLIAHPNATFVIRSETSCMTRVGVHHDDMLLVDRSLTPEHSDIVLAVVDGDFRVRQLMRN